MLIMDIYQTNVGVSLLIVAGILTASVLMLYLSSPKNFNPSGSFLYDQMYFNVGSVLVCPGCHIIVAIGLSSPFSPTSMIS